MKALAIVFISLLCFSSNAADIKIGFIDTNQVVSNLSQYKSSLELISNEFEPKKQELLDLFKHIELLRSKIESIKKTDPSISIDAELLKLSNF